jgi:hypothetical protein
MNKIIFYDLYKVIFSDIFHTEDFGAFLHKFGKYFDFPNR